MEQDKYKRLTEDMKYALNEGKNSQRRVTAIRDSLTI